MYPTDARLKELRVRFGVSNGQFFGPHKYKNLNWYFGEDPKQPPEDDEWFCYGDVREEDLPRLSALLQNKEFLLLGWKELGPNHKFEEIAREGGGLWLIITRDNIVDVKEVLLAIHIFRRGQ